MEKKGLLQRLDEGVVIGDGGYSFQLEKRGYVYGGRYTPEAVVEKPHAVMNLHREFLDSGSDVLQAFTFASTDGRLSYGMERPTYSCETINKAACYLAKTVSLEGDVLVSGSISQTPTYSAGRGKEAVQLEFKKQLRVFEEYKLDFLIAEFFSYIEEMEWAIEVCLETGLTVVAAMAIGPEGDMTGVPPSQCGIRMAKAGARVVGVSCKFDFTTCLKTVKLMKDAVEAEGVKVHFITQPMGYHAPECDKYGYINLPEFPFAMEPRTCTRFDFHRYAREAYDLGVRYIGGCCGTEAYHIRAIVEELQVERGDQKQKPFACKKHEPWGEGLKMSTNALLTRKAHRSYWETLQPSSGRPSAGNVSHQTSLASTHNSV